jgi:ribosome-binding factor A
MVSKTRAVRIAERIREDLSDLLLQQVHDPRLEGITITDVTVDRELAFAEIYISSFYGEERSSEILSGLDHAQGYLRTELAKRINLRRFPRLRFHWDSTFERAERIDRLIAKIQEDESTEKRSEENDDHG